MRKFSLSVGEPWDFEGPDGQNKVELELLGEVDGPIAENWATSYLLLKVIRPFSFNGEAVECLVAAPRYEGESLRSVFQNGGTVGVGRVLPGRSIHPGQKLLTSDTQYCIIGRLDPHSEWST